MHSATGHTTGEENDHGAADTRRGVPYYRLRAYRDALIIAGIATVVFVMLRWIDWPGYLVTWLYKVRGWKLDSMTVLSLIVVAGSGVFVLRRRSELLREINQREQIQAEQARLIRELEEAIANVKTLGGLLPICGWCKKIRDDRGYWKQVEAYLQEHTDATFTHGICPECEHKLRAMPGDQS